MNSTPRVSLDSLDLLDSDGGVRAPSPSHGSQADTLRNANAVDGLNGQSLAAGAVEATAWSGVAAGSLIDGKYRVLGELGSGAMGVVMLAHDERLDRKVAVKLIRAELARPGFHARFLEEARAMARVNHRNVVQIYACGEHAKVPYFVMELVNGSTVEEWMVGQPGTVDVAVAVRILASVCEGVSAIHAANTLHRDIKPSNILLDANRHPRMADLGVSTLRRSRRASRPEIVGTPAYMAPEMAFPLPGARPTQRADVYSLGCVAYELLTGRLPVIPGEGDWTIQHAMAEVKPPSHFRPDLPVAFDRVLLAALAKDPKARTPTAEAFRRDLVIASGESLDPVRILVAEDHDESREALEEGLKAEFPHAEVIGVSNGRAALDALSERSASVAILDLEMPEMGGLEVTRRLRATETASSMPIIVLTGSGGPEAWKELLSLGADRFLTKPVSLGDLVMSVRSSLRERASTPPPPPT